ncbi:MAG TPA: alginate O-acetyltransferase AlgF [Emcibacteraceae bacterium]|nr:alginate O-acetyltransferase AlgF [Emcibacteraceae bacterium]
MAACKDTQADSDVGLYDPVAPAGSAFVRFINLEEGAVTPKAGKKSYGALSQGQISDYFVIPQGHVSIDMGGHAAEEEFQADNYYTAINKGDVIFLRDQANTDRSKATIALYNLSDIPALTLKAREGSVDVLKDVAKDETAARDMNAVKIDFSIYNGDQKLKSLDEEVIERGNHYSIIYDGQTAEMVAAKTNTRR